MASTMNPELASAIIASAKRLGVDPLHIATTISYETGGKMDPNLWGGKNNNHLGYIQFGGPERQKYGVREGMTPTEQMTAVENYLRDRGVKPGMGLMDVYSTVNAGAPGLYNRSDAANGGAPGTVADKVTSQMGGHVENARRLLGGDGVPVGALATGAPAPVDPVSPINPTSTSSDTPLPAAAPAGPSALDNLASALSGPKQGAAPAAPQQTEYAPLQTIQPVQPMMGQSQQIAAALAKAYGITA